MKSVIMLSMVSKSGGLELKNSKKKHWNWFILGYFFGVPLIYS